MPKDFWYIAPKEGQKYAIVGSSNWSDTASKVEFDELGFISEDDFYHVYAYAHLQTVSKES
jgi:phosphatidylserine/phosphatidylglycerophosphate/cardiolipin synthase-like enzyme